jgi:hypothetical protein
MKIPLVSINTPVSIWVKVQGDKFLTYATICNSSINPNRIDGVMVSVFASSVVD